MIKWCDGRASLTACLLLEQEDNEMYKALDGDAEGMLASEAEALKMFLDAKDIAKCFTVRSNDKLQLYSKTW